MCMSADDSFSIPPPKTQVSVSVERDSRAMNHMDPESKLIHAQLEEWARWARDTGIMGYPKQSLTEKAAQYGRLGIPQESNYRAEPLMPEHVARMDAVVASLCQTDQQAIKGYYCRWEVADAGLEALARRLSMRVRQLQNVLRRARWRIAIKMAQTTV